MPPSAPRLVIFDCDGVLIDSEIIAAKAQSQALAEHGIAITPQEAARRFGERNLLLDFAQIEREHGLVPAAFAEDAGHHGWHGNVLLFREAVVRGQEAGVCAMAASEAQSYA